MRHIDKEILFGRTSIYKIPEILNEMNPYKVGIVIDRKILEVNETVNQIVYDSVKPDLTYILEDGREAKRIDVVLDLWRRMYRSGFGRRSVLIAMGGGGIGDMVGFAASTYMRGIRWINIPTTLLAQADSCIGGKTGIDFIGKNIIGTFHIPEVTIIDPNLLNTLPQELIIEGLSEIIKHSLLSGGDLYRLISRHKFEDLLRNGEILDEILLRSIRFKLSIVEQDYMEKGHRRCLNFGHTIGHALEAYKKYRISHGKAISIGIKVESYLSHKILDFDKLDQVASILRNYRQPTHLDTSIAHLIPWIEMDKKNWRGIPTFTLLEDIGRWRIVEIETRMLREILNEAKI